jgi:hypothetical protein
VAELVAGNWWQATQWADPPACCPACADSKVTTVKVSNRLDITPCVVVTGQFGNSANMERIQRYQVGAAQPGATYLRH